jgi:tetratricopeptide (TPR) repeat protein
LNISPKISKRKEGIVNMDAKGFSNKKQEKAPQEVVQKNLGTLISELITNNLKLIGIGAAVIIVVLAIIFGWSLYTRNLNANALVLENKAYEVYNTIDESKTEKSEAVTKAYQEALGLYQEIITKYPSTASAERAIYLYGSLEYTLGDYDKALEYYNTYLKKYSNGKLRLQAEEGIGYIFEQKGEYQKAIDQFKSLDAKIPATRKAELLLAIGRNYENLKQTEEAVKTYQSIVDLKATGFWSEKAKERLEILQGGSASKSAEIKPAASESTAAATAAPQAGTPEATAAATPAPQATNTPEPVSTPTAAPQATNTPAQQ